MATFDETVNIVNDFLYKSSIFNKYFPSESHQDFVDSLNMMLKCFEILSKDEEVDKSVLDSVTKLNRTLESIRIFVLDEVLYDHVVTFIESWVNLVSNWNNNVLKDKNMSSMCDLIIRFLQGHFTNLEAIQILKHQNKLARQLRHWLPPAFELSMHYIESLTTSQE